MSQLAPRKASPWFTEAPQSGHQCPADGQGQPCCTSSNSPPDFWLTPLNLRIQPSSCLYYKARMCFYFMLSLIWCHCEVSQLFHLHQAHSLCWTWTPVIPSNTHPILYLSHKNHGKTAEKSPPYHPILLLFQPFPWSRALLLPSLLCQQI